MSLIIGIQFEGDFLKALQEMQNDLRTVLEYKKNYTKSENLYLKLTEIEGYDDAAKVLEVLKTVPLEPFSITTDGGRKVGYDFVCDIAELDGKHPADRYNRRIRSALTKAGIPYVKLWPQTIIVLFSHNWFLSHKPIDTSGFKWKPTTMAVRKVKLMKEERPGYGKETSITVLGAVEAQ